MANDLPIAPTLIDRFRLDLLALHASPPTDLHPIALAISGGPDSMAMLALAAAAFPGHVVAATFDHGLRADAAAEAAMVAAWCADRGIPHATLRPATPLPATNVQAAARTARYAALHRWAIDRGAAVLATAHHADDQAETFLMRANRGSGLAGLAGIRARRPVDATLAVVRPLLGWRRQTLRDVVTVAGIPFVTDPSNTDDRFDRARIRRLLAEEPRLDPAQLARAAGWLGEAEADWRAVGDWLWHDRRRPPATDTHTGDDAGTIAIDVADLPRTLRRLLARHAIAAVRQAHAIATPAFSDASPVESLLDSLAAGRTATHAGVIASAKAEIWRFRPAPPRRSR